MATTADIKNGLCIVFNNDIYSIVEFLHVKPGKGAAFVRTKMRNVKTGRMLENTFLDLRGMTGVDFDEYAKRISAECWRQTSIPVSVGVAPSKTLAKIASKLCKQYPKLRGGCYMHRPQDIEKVLRKFPVEDVWGIGRRSAAKLHTMGVKTAWDYVQLPEMAVRKMFGLVGIRTWRELQGQPCIEFEDGFEAKQSICVSRSFAHEISDVEELSEQLRISLHPWRRNCVSSARW